MTSKTKQHQLMCELPAAKLLNAHYGKNPDEKDTNKMEFRRTPGSGGWDKNKAPGDVQGPDWFPFNVECKFRQDLTLDTLFFTNTKQMDDWWAQAEADCEDGPRYRVPMIIVRMMRRKPMVFFAMSHFQTMLSVGTHTPRPMPAMLVLPAQGRRPTLVGMMLEEFTELFPNRKALQPATTPKLLREADRDQND